MSQRLLDVMHGSTSREQNSQRKVRFQGVKRVTSHEDVLMRKGARSLPAVVTGFLVTRGIATSAMKSHTWKNIFQQNIKTPIILNFNQLNRAGNIR